MHTNIYLRLTEEFNRERVCAVLAGGQAVVLHRLAVMSKDGDWVLREDEEVLAHVLGVLGKHGARYRFGAPLDTRWLAGGWSAHLEFQHEGWRVRTDFITRPPRLDAQSLLRLWTSQRVRAIPTAALPELAEMKKTNREKDYAVIGELARLMKRPEDQILYSRSARDLMELSKSHPELIHALTARRPVLSAVMLGRDELEAALDAERRQLIHTNEERLERYMNAAEDWADAWPEVDAAIRHLPLSDAHAHMVQRAEMILPVHLEEGR